MGEWLQSRERYSSGSHLGLPLNNLILAYVKHAKDYYRKDGMPTSEVGAIKAALRHVRKLYGLTAAKDFGPLALKTVRDSMVAGGWARTTVNQQIIRVRRMFRWAASWRFRAEFEFSVRVRKLSQSLYFACGRFIKVPFVLATEMRGVVIADASGQSLNAQRLVKVLAHLRDSTEHSVRLAAESGEVTHPGGLRAVQKAEDDLPDQQRCQPSILIRVVGEFEQPQCGIQEIRVERTHIGGLDAASARERPCDAVVPFWSTRAGRAQSRDSPVTGGSG